MWAHKYGHVDEKGFYLPEPNDPKLDAYSGATPIKSFDLKTKLDKAPPQKLNVFFEVNQSFD